MSIDPDDIYERGTLRAGEVRREQDVDFDVLIYEMAEGIADAQLKLDYNTAEAAALFGEVEVPIIPQVTRQIGPDGRVTTSYGDRENRTLLELGFTPTRYQFSEVQMDVEFDLKLQSDEDDRTRLRTSTAEAHHHRKYRREIDTTAKLSATLVPVPTPAGLTPAEAHTTGTEPTEPGSEEEPAESADDGGSGGSGSDEETEE
jgi:hypothetical protein